MKLWMLTADKQTTLWNTGNEYVNNTKTILSRTFCICVLSNERTGENHVFIQTSKNIMRVQSDTETHLVESLETHLVESHRLTWLTGWVTVSQRLTWLSSCLSRLSCHSSCWLCSSRTCILDSSRPLCCLSSLASANISTSRLFSTSAFSSAAAGLSAPS